MAPAVASCGAGRRADVLERAELHAAIEAAIAAPPAGAPAPVGLLLVRTRRLREFEMLFGYAEAERLRDAMAMRLADALRPGDQVFRIGECDFAIVLPRLHDRQHAALAAAKVSRVLRAPFDVQQRPARASVTVGAATWPRDGTDPESLCRRADRACKAAARRRERHALFEGSDDPLVGHDAVHDAIANNQLQVYLQPIHALADGSLVGLESLARWRTPGGWIPPAVFVAIAEDTGLIEELTRWSIHTTLRHCAPVLRARPGLTCSINLSPRAVLEQDIVQQVQSSLQIWGVRPEALVVEVTETAFVGDAVHVARVLTDLHEMGVGVSIDDYGTGYSSLAYLRHFPVAELKVDRSFVAEMRGNPRSVQLVASMIELAHRLGAIAIAEGVEDEADLEILRGLGCDRYQGYLVARPAAAEEVLGALMDRAGVLA